MHQYSFSKNNHLPNVFLIPTPIGNLEEISTRIINTLNECDVIYCEDTRETKKLLNFLNINKKLKSLFKHNELQKVEEFKNDLTIYKNVGIVSDKGTPLISDPGYVLIKNLLKVCNFNLVPISGPTAFVSALITSGLPSDKFYFHGFIDKNNKNSEYDMLKTKKNTIIIYESPNRIIKTLIKIKEEIGDVDVCVAKEITKINEQFLEG